MLERKLNNLGGRLMSRISTGLLLCTAALAPAAAHAESLASSASSASSASVGSLSDSVRGSSDSSKNTAAQVDDGDYRIVEVADVPERAQVLRLKLQATTRDGEGSAFWLDLPRETYAREALAPGRLVSTRARPYGIEFAHADSRAAFFLVLADDWMRELDPRAVKL
jgi:hypothetical protein